MPCGLPMENQGERDWRARVWFVEGQAVVRVVRDARSQVRLARGESMVEDECGDGAVVSVPVGGGVASDVSDIEDGKR